MSRLRASPSSLACLTNNCNGYPAVQAEARAMHGMNKLTAKLNGLPGQHAENNLQASRAPTSKRNVAWYGLLATAAHMPEPTYAADWT